MQERVKNVPQTTHPSTNRVWRSATTLIEANALPLSQTANQYTVCITVYKHLSAIPAAVTSDLKHMIRNVGKFITKRHRRSSWSMEYFFSEPTHYTTGSFQSHQQSTEENMLFCIISIAAI